MACVSDSLDSGNPVLVRASEGFAEIRFNRPQRLNALDVDMAVAFRDAVDRIVVRSDIKAIILSAEGRSFMAGGDLTFLRSAPDRGAAARAILEPMNAALLKLGDAPQIVIASLKGPVAGAGMSLTLEADLAVAASDTSFRLAYSRVGVSPDCGGSWALPRLVGLRRAIEIALFSDTIDAAAALEIGLVNRVVDADKLEEAALKFARHVAAGSAMAQALTKRLLRDAYGATHEEQLSNEAGCFARCADAPDFAEGVDAFFEKRPPRFGQKKGIDG